jgi:hypothetical protein
MSEVRLAASMDGPDSAPVVILANPIGTTMAIWDAQARVLRERMVPAHADALRGLRAIWIDAGTSDEYHLDLGAEAFRAALGGIGVADDLVYFELSEAGHMGIDYRYPMSLAWLCGRMTK